MDYNQALARVRSGEDAFAVARNLVSALTEDERLWCLDGDAPTWAGLIDLTSGGYHKRVFRGASLERIGFEGILFSDGPRGVVTGPATCFPVSMSRGASFNPELEEEIGAAMGRELSAIGANLTGAVCINLLRHPGWGRAQETYGEDPHHVGEMGAALTRGLQRYVMACVKHFAVNSIENSRFKVDVQCTDDVLQDVYLAAFERVVDEGVASVMSAYNLLNGDFCGENRHLLTELLRGGLGFEGFVISDWILGLRDGPESVRAGLNVEMPFRMIRSQTLRAAIDSGELSLEQVDELVVQTIGTCLRFDAVQDWKAQRKLHTRETAILTQEHLALSRRAAAEGMVLLENSDSLLPLRLEPGSKLLVVGALAGVANTGDAGSSHVMSPSVVTPIAGITSRFSPVGVDVSFDSGADLGQLAELASQADVVVVVTGFTKADEGEFIGGDSTNEFVKYFPPSDDPHEVELFNRWIEASSVDTSAFSSEDRNFGEGGDRRSLRLKQHDEDVLLVCAQANPKTVAVIVGGSAVVGGTWQGQVGAYLYGFYSGAEGGSAIAEVLAGDSEPSGRLPFSIPASASSLPDFDPDADVAVYDQWHGYWKLANEGAQVAYPFGFGLGYAQFETVAASLASGGGNVVVEHRNVCGVSGADVLQVYAAGAGLAFERLVGFAKVVLSPGESKSTVIELDRRRLRNAQGYSLRVARNYADPGVAI